MIIQGTYFIGVGAYCDQTGNPNGHQKPVVANLPEGGQERIGTLTIYNPSPYKSTNNSSNSLHSAKSRSNAPQAWYIELTLDSGYDLDEVGLYLVNDLPGSFTMDDFIVEKPADGSNTYKIFLSNYLFNQLDFGDIFYIAAYAKFCTTN